MHISPLKSPLGLAALACLAASMSASATVSLQFSSTSIYATNWADGAGAGDTSLYWGIIVDTDGDGLAANYLTAGVDYGAVTAGSGQGGRVGQALRDENNVLTDDVLYMNNLTMQIVSATQAGRDGSLEGQNRISVMASIPFVPGMQAGDPFYLVWFDRAGAPISVPSGAPQGGEKYGIFGDASFILPSEGSTVSFSPVFTGPDPLHQMTHAWVPEPATGALSLLGAMGLVRRRR